MLKFLPKSDVEKIKRLSGNIEEIRIRINQPIVVTHSERGVRKKSVLDVIYDEFGFESILTLLCENSFFSKEESLKQGFITSSEGERVGICGNIVHKGVEVVTVKEITSFCIRFPNCVENIALPFFEKYITQPKSCLIISSPSQGKTTFLRDLGRLYSDRLNKNILYIDERDEFCASGAFYLGKNADVLKYSDKNFGFYNGVRSLNPDIIVSDEIMNEGDLSACVFASLSGVKSLASAHSDSLKNLLKKSEFQGILEYFIFDYFIELRYGGNIKVYDGEGRVC